MVVIWNLLVLAWKNIGVKIMGGTKCLVSWMLQNAAEGPDQKCHLLVKYLPVLHSKKREKEDGWMRQPGNLS